MLLLTLTVPDVAVDPRTAADSALCDEAKVITELCSYIETNSWSQIYKGRYLLHDSIC